MLEILGDAQAPKANKIKALRILNEVLPGRQHEADMHGAIDTLRPYLMQPPNGLLLNTIVAFNTLIHTEDLARKMLPDVPRVVEVIDPAIERPLRREAAKLLRIIAEFVGPEPPFLAGTVPSAFVAAVGSRESEPDFLFEAYRLLSYLANKQSIRGVLTESSDVLNMLVRSFSNASLRHVALIFASNLAMDPLHRAKGALLNADILANIAEYLRSPDANLRFAVLSLIALLAVPKDGKSDIAQDDNLPTYINEIIAGDPDESCKEAAKRVKILVSELPAGRAIMGE
jgi:signal transduction histidine kinase